MWVWVSGAIKDRMSAGTSRRQIYKLVQAKVYMYEASTGPSLPLCKGAMQDEGDSNFVLIDGRAEASGWVGRCIT